MKKSLFTVALFLSFFTTVFAVDRDLPGIDLISRDAWGADESWLLL